MTDQRPSPALALLPSLGAAARRSDIAAVADEYERWLPLQQLSQQAFGDPQLAGDLPLLRRAFAIGQEAEANLRVRRYELSRMPSRDLDELARKARILQFDCSDWLMLDADPLLASVCGDALRLASVPPIPEPYSIPDDLTQRFGKLDFDAPPLPWEDRP